MVGVRCMNNVMGMSPWAFCLMGAVVNAGWFMVTIGNDNGYGGHGMLGSTRPPSLLGGWVPASLDFRPPTVEHQRT